METEKKEIEILQEVEDIKSELNNKYLLLLADFENYKKRVKKEKEDLVSKTKVDMLSVILDLDSDLSIARKSIVEDEGLKIIFSKIDKFLSDQGIESIQTETYDPDLHEVISVIETGEEKVVDVINKGYKINDSVFRYPKIILSK